MAQAMILIFFLCVFGGHPPGGNWGQNIGSFRGVIAYSNGSDTGKYSITEPVGEDGTKYQCIEYCRRFYRVYYGVDTGQWELNAKDWYGFSRFWTVKRFPNNGTSLPQPTDILCFKNRPYGHVAIVTSVEGNLINVIQENASADTAYGQVEIVNGIVQNDCQGWLRKKE